MSYPMALFNMETYRDIPEKTSDFGELFKKFRLRSEIETLTAFGNLLAEKGFSYETSLFTRWQNGQRVPRNRKILLTMVEVFVRRGGIQTEEEITTFLAMANQRDLNDRERLYYQQFFHNHMSLSLPKSDPHFVGRERIIKDILHDLLHKKRVLLFGPTGIGKTAIAVKISHILQNIYKDGMFWFCLKNMSMDAVIDRVFEYFHVQNAQTESIEQKMIRFHRLLRYRQVLFVWDNIMPWHGSFPLFKTILHGNYPILMTARESSPEMENKEEYEVAPFNHDEYLAYAIRILGDAYVKVNGKELKEIAERVKYIPSCMVRAMSMVSDKPKEIKKIISLI